MRLPHWLARPAHAQVCALRVPSIRTRARLLGDSCQRRRTSGPVQPLRVPSSLTAVSVSPSVSLLPRSRWLWQSRDIRDVIPLGSICHCSKLLTKRVRPWWLGAPLRVCGSKGGCFRDCCHWRVFAGFTCSLCLCLLLNKKGRVSSSLLSEGGKVAKEGEAPFFSLSENKSSSVWLVHYTVKDRIL